MGSGPLIARLPPDKLVSEWWHFFIRDQNSQKKRGARSSNKPDKKPAPQEDNSDLKCQLHFAKEESALMCKKLTKLVKDSEAMKEELAKYRSLYGDVNSSLTVEEVADSPHTREAEVRVHLKLVEEEANLLSRRIVELEVENRGLRAEMDEMKGSQDGHQELSSVGPGAGLGGAVVLGGGASSENVMELQRHLQFVEEEAELLRRSLIEMEEQNKLLMNEINRYKSELPPATSALSAESLMSLTDGLLNDSHSVQDGAVLISTDTPTPEEELRLTRLQVGELSGKLKKLQYENRVLLSNLQRCDLASYHAPSSSSSSSSLRLALETDAEAGDSAECLPLSPPHRKEPVGGENDAKEMDEQKKKIEDNAEATTPLSGCLGQKDRDALLAMRDQARLVSTAIQLLTSPESNCLSSSSSPSLYHKVCSNEAAEPCDLEKPQPHCQISELSDLADRPLVGALTSRLQALHTQLQAFVEQVDGLGKPPSGGRDAQVEGASPPASPCASVPCSGDSQDQDNKVEHKQPDYRDQSDPDEKDGTYQSSQSISNNTQNRAAGQTEQEKETDRSTSVQLSDLQAQLSTEKESARGTLEELERERQNHKGISLRLSQLQEEHQKALLRRDFQLQSLGLQARLQQKLWGQERTLLVQESQHLKQALLLLSLKLRCFLKQWRLGCKKDAEGKDVLEMNSLKDLYLLLEEEESQADKRASADEQPLSPTIKSSAVSSTLADLKVALQDLSAELRQERQGSQELTQQFAKAKASWEVERTELKSLIMQFETKLGKTTAALSSTETLDPLDLKVALKKEREEHQHLLAESYAAVMDLTKQLQIGERNWSREKLELLERFSQERTQWEQRLRDAATQQEKVRRSKPPGDESTVDTAGVVNGSASPRIKSTLEDSEGSRSSCAKDKAHFGSMPLFTGAEFGDVTVKNWTSITNETPEMADTCKTWDGPSGSCSSSAASQMDLDFVQRSCTAPDRTGIRIYYSPPAVRRMEHRRRYQEPLDSDEYSVGGSSLKQNDTDGGVASLDALDAQRQQPASSFTSSYEQWLSSLSKQHRELLESRGSSISTSMPSVFSSSVSGGAANRVVDGMTSSSPFHDLEIGDISANLSDDMKEMTNCVRQAIRSSSLERKSSKEPGSQPVGVSNKSTQTAAQGVSIGLQTETSRATGLHSKSWSPRPTPATTSSLVSARTRQISTSLDKVHSRIERPCCSPKYGSPKLQRRVSSGSTSRLDGASSSRDRSMWSLHQRPIGGSGGSAWARSTTTRDSPVLNGLTDGLSSLFSVVEHSGSTESLWRSEIGSSQTASPARQPHAAGKPSGAAACGSDSNPQRYGGLVQEFFRNVCNSRGPGGAPLSVEKVQRDSLAVLGGVGVLGGLSSVDEPTLGGAAALAGLSGGNDSVTRIVNKRFMRQTAGEEMISIMGGGKEATSNSVAAGPGTEEAPCDCATPSSCFVRSSRAAARHCKHRPQDSPAGAEEKGDACNE
ncbi:PREDICTED: protein SOGA1-like [Poecilia mexicana]|uniref:protein SOGA1-like n=1 Tax=Poecilia mexicana TaxID=48701 RepID=UPI00072DCA56|nr:PREDICTED: protein SOGA1-like [Poecilia mexicana]